MNSFIAAIHENLQRCRSLLHLLAAQLADVEAQFARLQAGEGEVTAYPGASLAGNREETSALFQPLAGGGNKTDDFSLPDAGNGNNARAFSSPQSESGNNADVPSRPQEAEGNNAGDLSRPLVWNAVSAPVSAASLEKNASGASVCSTSLEKDSFGAPVSSSSPASGGSGAAGADALPDAQALFSHMLGGEWLRMPRDTLRKIAAMLLHLRGQPAGNSGAALSAMLGMSAGGTGKFVMMLKRRGLITRVGHQHYALTQKALDLIAGAAKERGGGGLS